METELRLDGAGPDDVSVLRRMIDADSSLSGLRLIPAAEKRPGEMGQGVEVLQAVLGPGGTGVAFAGVLVAWLRSRRKRIKLRVATKNGVIEVDSQGITNPAESIEQIVNLLDS